jgi:replication factor C subunit 2/4
MSDKRPWIERYRPKKIEDILLPDTLATKIASLSRNSVIPNLIVSGPPGTGKTSTLLALATRVYGKKFKEEAVMELNASDNRGLEMINNSIIYFCKKRMLDAEGKPMHKLIILDEADNITRKAQNTLSNMMEEYADNTKFAFTCNDSTKIIESIQSRCLMIFFPPLKNDQIAARLTNICEREGVAFQPEAVRLVAVNARGDLRQAINNLEAVRFGFGGVTQDGVMRLCHQPHPDKIIKLIQECANRNTDQAIAMIDDLKRRGYCSNDILLTMISVLRDVQIVEEVRLEYIRTISESYIQVCDGVDSNLQLYGCIARLVMLRCS